MIEPLEWIGALVGIAGALMMAMNHRVSPWAYPVWIVASLAMFVFAWEGQHFGLALQQAVFFCINLLGLYRWLIRPAQVIGQALDHRA
jgi:nicotinamide riboside transporter PnuC